MSTAILARPSRRTGASSLGAQSADRCNVDAYRVDELGGDADVDAYTRLLAAVYEPLGFMNERILPGPQSRAFLVRYRQQVVGIFRLTEVSDTASPYHRWMPTTPGGRAPRWLEVNNVIVAAEFRATILLGLMLYRSACIAQRDGYDAVVGITRWQTLRFFVDFGVVPVEHPPLHLLGRDDLHDFIIYYDTRDPVSVAYMHQRSARWFHQQHVLRRLQNRYLPRSSNARQGAASSALSESVAGVAENGTQACQH